jgi:hypothetical protein
VIDETAGPADEFQARAMPSQKGWRPSSAGRQLSFLFVVRISPWPGGSAPRTRAICAAEVSDKSGLDPMDRTKEVHLADIDAVVAEGRVGHHDMEIDVRDRHLQKVVLAAKDLAGRPGEADLPLGGTYCASVTLSANAMVFRMRART